MDLHHALKETENRMPPRGSSGTVLLASYRNPQNTSPYLMSGAPTCCAQCAHPFSRDGEHDECWHGADNRYYCSEECASKRRRRRGKAA